MSKLKVYVSFDFDNDESLKTMLIGQAKNQDTPFEFSDFSIKSAISKDWIETARRKINLSDKVLVLLGKNTHKAQGVLKEVTIARELKKPLFQVKLSDQTNLTPVNDGGRVINWTWDNLKTYLK